MSQITRILSNIQRGDSAAAEQLLPLVYQELRQLAAAKMARESPGHTLSATAPPLEETPNNPLLARLAGFSLHAATVCEAPQRNRLERLCRYITPSGTARRTWYWSHWIS
jgi:hypothetical protein